MKTLSELLQRAWYGGALWYWPLLVMLWPLSLVFCVLASRRRRCLQKAVAALPVPVVIVGNISVGGTGKTPLLCALAADLQQRGWRVGIISRGYGGSHSGAPRSVTSSDEAAIVGDEPLLLARNTGCPVVIDRDRLAAAHYLLQHSDIDIILSDDGLQHYTLPRNVEIAVVDGARGVGNGLCLPAGPLREPVVRLTEVDYVVINGQTDHVFRSDQVQVQVLPYAWRELVSGVCLPLDTLAAGTAVHAVAGIGNPQRFFHTLRTLGLKVVEHPFADHHAFTAADLQFGDVLPVVMTEKDAVKCVGITPHNSFALCVQIQLPTSWTDRLLAQLQKFSGGRQ